MTKFEQKSFSSPANSKAYVDNWERTFGQFGEGREIDLACVHCGKPVEPVPPWTKVACSIECERAHYRELGD